MDRCVQMDFAGKTNVSSYNESPDSRIWPTTGLQLALDGYIIIIRLQTVVGDEISS